MTGSIKIIDLGQLTQAASDPQSQDENALPHMDTCTWNSHTSAATRGMIGKFHSLLRYLRPIYCSLHTSPSISILSWKTHLIDRT